MSKRRFNAQGALPLPKPVKKEQTKDDNIGTPKSKTFYFVYNRESGHCISKCKTSSQEISGLVEKLNEFVGRDKHGIGTIRQCVERDANMKIIATWWFDCQPITAVKEPHFDMIEILPRYAVWRPDKRSFEPVKFGAVAV